jgi:hypothetical protein
MERQREALIDSALPVAQGSVALFHGCTPRTMKESGNHVFAFRLSFRQDGQ